LKNTKMQEEMKKSFMLKEKGQHENEKI
jgi:hypothetical protein